ncbi:cilia- and flagella-associated protein 57-like [Aplochiton taeniatus]
MSSVVAQCHHVFGIRSGVANNLCYFDEQTVIFPSGNNCVKYNVDQKWQKFIPGVEKSQGMYALAISANRRYLAVSERSDKATITVYDLQHEQSKKRKVLSGGEIPVQEFVSLCFSADSKYLIGQSGAPDWILFYWMWEKQKVMATVKTSVTANPVKQISLNPYDNTQVCVTGNGIFKVFRYTEGTLKQSTFQKLDPHNFLSHVWMSEERVIAGTDTGKLMVFESGDLRWEMVVTTKRTERWVKPVVEQTDQAAAPQLPRITVITAYSKGFACSAGPGTVCLFDKTEEKDTYKKTREIKIPPDQCCFEPSQAELQQIESLVISPSEETLVTSTEKGQLYSITLSSAEISKGAQAQFEYLTHSFHSGVITGLSICIRKPIIATCSLDQSVRIWNFKTNTLELYKEFQEEAFSIALHPSGLFVLVGFSDKLRLMNLLIDDIRSFKEFTVRGCRECAFSYGGHLFAAVNGNVIHIYSATTFENILNLKGHNGKVRSIVWSADDSRLVSCGMEGAVYEWNTLTSKRETESVLKTCSYSGVTISPDAKTIFAVGTDCTLKEIQDCQILREVSAEDVAYTTVAMSRTGRLLFTGTSIGTIRAIKYPLSAQKDWVEYQAHSAPVTKMVITFDDQYLLSVSEDGCLVIWRIIDKDGRGLKRDKEITYMEEILITKCDLEEKNVYMLELKTRVEELKMENEYQLRLKDINYSEKMKEMSEKFVQQIEALKTKIQLLKSEADKMEGYHQESMSEVLEGHAKDMQGLAESANSQKLMLEYEKYQELQLKLQHMQAESEKQLQKMEQSKVLALGELTGHYEVKIQEKLLVLEQVQEEARTHMREFEESRKQIEEDGDREIQDIRMRFERWLRDEKETNMRMKGDTGIMKKKFSSLQKDIDDRNVEIDKMKSDHHKQQCVIRSLEKDILALRKQIQERDETIQDKEKRIYDLKKKNQELDKFKFVLDFKIKELKNQIEPSERNIKKMKDQIEEMEEELAILHQKNSRQDLDIAQFKSKLSASDKEMKKERLRMESMEALVHKFKTDLHNCVNFIQEPNKLKGRIRELYLHYVQQSDVTDIVGENLDIQKEYARQREHLERNVASLKRKMSKDHGISYTEKTKIMQENVTLIGEINDLRHELRVVRSQNNNYERLLKHTKKDKTQAFVDLQAKLSPREKLCSKVVRLNALEEGEHLIQLQRLEIQRLREQILTVPENNPHRPPSTAKLPTLNCPPTINDPPSLPSPRPPPSKTDE